MQQSLSIFSKKILFYVWMAQRQQKYPDSLEYVFYDSFDIKKKNYFSMTHR